MTYQSPLRRLTASQRASLAAGPADPGAPMLAVPWTGAELAAGWLFERKLDGVRALAVRADGEAHLLSRTGRRLDATFPELVDVLRQQRCRDFVADGEVVALRDGRTDFGLLQQRSGATRPGAHRIRRVEVSYFLFDLLGLDGQAVGGLPLSTRKELMAEALDFRPPLHLTAHERGGATVLLARACELGWEGLVAKRADAPYRHGRSGDWVKLKCEAAQEFVIGGFTEPGGSRVGFGALLLGYYEGAQLRYAGKVGTGWSIEELRVLRAGLDRIEQAEAPFLDPPRERAVHWVRPVLVAQVRFAQWTRDGRLRGPRFLGLRDDKAPRQVVREPFPGAG